MCVCVRAHMCGSTPKAINYINMIFIKFVTFRKVTKQFFVWAWQL